MKRVAILGLGLMGGSLGLALKRAGFSGVISAYARRAETRTKALELGVCDEVYDDPCSAVCDADVSVCCVPVSSIMDLLQQAFKNFKAGAVVTDVGSTKRKLMLDAADIFGSEPASFIGSHPMAGSERQGLTAASADLYDHATVVITPASNSDLTALKTLENLWTSVGARIVVMSAAEHDRLVARTSHLPHVVASLLAAVVGRGNDFEQTGQLCGTGFADTTRIAEGSARLWRDIVESNHDYLLAELTELKQQYDSFVDLLRAENFDGIERYFKQSGALRQRLLAVREENIE